MVHPVVLWSIEDMLKWPNVVYHLSVDPELVEQIKLGMHQHVGGWNKEGHW